MTGNFVRSVKSAALMLMVSMAIGCPVFAEVYLTVRDGRVSIIAKDATVGEILAEWAKSGQTRIVNAERIPLDRVTLELVNVTEGQALDVLLRKSSGYIAASRATAVANASQFDHIIIMPPSVAPQTNTAAPVAARVSPTPLSDTASYPTPMYEVPRDQAQPQIAEGQPAAVGANVMIAVEDQQPYTTTAGATAAPSATAQKSFAARRALEVVDPRQFQLPKRPQGAAVPLPRVPGQPGIIRRLPITFP
jgi:hypothetical protein